MMSSEVAPIAAADLCDFVVRAFRSQGVPDADASRVATLMVEADIYGYATHGVFRLRQYMARLNGGGCNPHPRLSVVHETAATALIDGDNGLGHLAMNRARELAMVKAGEAGIGWVGVRRGNHAGPLALYVRPQAEAAMIGMAAAVGSANHVPPYGGTDLLLGTNPLAISAPGTGMPEGWMVGRDGKPLTDPNRRSEGFLLPIGGAKGFGLSVAIGLMAGVLNGAAFGSDVVDFTNDTSSPTNTGQFVMALDLQAFDMAESFSSNAERVFEELRTSTPLPGHDPVRLPGDGKGAAVAQRRKNGLSLNAALRRDLIALAEEYEISAPFDAAAG